MEPAHQVHREGDVAVVALQGPLRAREATALLAELETLAREPGIARVVLDFAAVDSVDTAAIGAVSLGRRRLVERDRVLAVKNLHGPARQAFSGTLAAGAPAPAPRGSFEGWAFGLVDRGWAALVRVSELAIDVALRTPGALFRIRRPPGGTIVEQAIFTGVDALPIVGLLTFLVGVVLAFQAAFQLKSFGAELYMVDIVGLGMILEFGPLITAVILAGRSGAAIAAELGTMSVQQEIDALRAMGLDPVRLLVVPRMAALTLAQPALTIIATMLGLLGGLIVAHGLGVSAPTYLSRLEFVVVPTDLWIGLGKSLLFSWLVGFIACFNGLRARAGPHSVGQATTSAVVATIFFIVVTDSIVTTASTILRHG